MKKKEPRVGGVPSQSCSRKDSLWTPLVRGTVPTYGYNPASVIFLVRLITIPILLGE